MEIRGGDRSGCAQIPAIMSRVTEQDSFFRASIERLAHFHHYRARFDKGTKPDQKPKKPALVQMRSKKLRDINRAAHSMNKPLEQFMVDRATHSLENTSPEYSASRVITRPQAVTSAYCAAVICIIALVDYMLALTLVEVFLCVFYLGGSILRLLILWDYEVDKPQELKTKLERVLASGKSGTYSVLVALYRETSQVKNLVDALDRLVWPKGCLEVFLVCEADDHDTLKALKAIKLPPHFVVLVVPDQEPKTKPKALNYALQLVSGDYVVLYDAEDRPHPWQLLEACNKFTQSEPCVACLQAPLAIRNQNANWLTRMFAIEYHTLFSGILPVLARWAAPMPLGGTSNHFKTSVLKKIGGWDPYNVTEDADLGMRMYRAGYQCGTITLPTLEEAPSGFLSWLCQRTRWIKGWMQTSLVHMRSPAATVSQMGPAGSLIFLFILLAIVISALVHPFYVATCLYYLPRLMGQHNNMFEVSVMIISVFNLLAGYLSYVALSHAVLRDDASKPSRWWLLLFPFYWLCVSFAAWRAMVQLVRAPFHWEKTEHVLTDAVKPQKM